MRKLILYAMSLFAIFAILMVGLDYLYSHIFQKSKPNLKVQKILQLKDQHFDVAFFGSSRTETHIDCKLIEELTGKSCINLGISGASITDMNFIMKAMASNHVTFSQTFMQIDYSYNHVGLTNFVKAGTTPFLIDPKIKNIFPAREKSEPYYWVPFYRYMIYNQKFGIRNLFASLLQKKNNLSIPLDINPNKGHGVNVGGSFPASLIKKNEDLDEMIEFTNAQKTPLIFFTAPYCKYVENRQIMDSIQERIPDLNNYISIFDNREEYFFNCGHLNETGAKEFTKILTEDLLVK